MSEPEPAGRGRKTAGASVTFASLLVACTAVLLTGGASSPLLLLLVLPVVVAAATGFPWLTVAAGAAASLSYAFVTRDWTTGGLITAMGIAGAAIASRGRNKEDDRLTLSPDEHQDLLGLAYSDPITGLYNFRKFRAHLDDELKRAARYGHPLSLILIDLDGFKSVNDQYGHPAGDRVLAAAAGVIKASVRASDLPARYGGEEFVVVCPETSAEEALVVAERIRSTLDQCVTEVTPHATCRITCSAGVATFPNHARDDIGLIETADEALYRAKAQGRNRVACPTATSAVT